jgi:hypothetical protein
MPENDEDESDSRGGRRQRAGRHESEALERWHDFVFAPTLGPATLGGNLAVFPLRTHRVETPSYLRAEEAGGVLHASLAMRLRRGEA